MEEDVIPKGGIERSRPSDHSHSLITNRSDMIDHSSDGYDPPLGGEPTLPPMKVSVGVGASARTAETLDFDPFRVLQ